MSQIKLLNTLLVTEDNGRLSPILKSPKGCALLAFLIVNNQPQSREKIGDLLWQATSTKQSLHRLRALLNRIRPYLPELHATRTTLSFHPSPERPVDLLQLLAALPSEDLDTVDAGLRRYQGDLLPDFYLANAPHFNEWLLVTRERLRRQVLLTYEQVCRTYAEEEQWSAAVDAARRWLVLDELDERAHRWLITCLLKQGDTAGARQQYEACRQLLWEELGVEPEPETAVLMQQFSPLGEQGTDRLTLPSPDQLAEPGALPANAYLPFHRNPNFTGRQETLLRLAKLLLPWPDAPSGQPRVVAIGGMAGLGKTQLAVEFAYRYGRYFPGGVFWLNFDDPESVVEEVARIGGERGLGLYREQEKLTLADRVGRVQRAWQEATPRLLIFDNCEVRELLAKWLPVSGGSRVLLTSRRSHWPQELHVQNGSLALLSKGESTALLQRLVPDLDTSHAAEIASELGHLPLALHLAGSFLRRYEAVSATDYLAQLRDKGLLRHPSLQGHGLSHSPTGHELDVARTFALNMKQLNADNEVDEMAQRLLAHAAYLAPGEPIPQTLLRRSVLVDDEDMMSLLNAEDGLRRLVALGFLQRKGQSHVLLHRLVAAFAKSELATGATAQTAVENTVIQWLKQELEKNVHLYFLPLPAGHVQHLVRMARPRGDRNAAQLANLWGSYLLENGEFGRAQPQLEEAVTIQQQIAPDNDPETAVMLNSLGTLLWHMGQIDAAWPYYEQALTIYRCHYGENHVETGRSFNNLGMLHRLVGDFDTSLAYMERALRIFETASPPDVLKIATVCFNLGILYNTIGKQKLAESVHRRSLQLFEQTLDPNHPSIARSLNSLGVTIFHTGQYDTAKAYFEQALAIWQTSGKREDSRVALASSNIGQVLLEMGELAQAKPWLEEALAIREKLYGRSNMRTARTLSLLGTLFARMGDVDKAMDYVQTALAIERQMQVEPRSLMQTLTQLGVLQQQMGAFEEAKQVLDEALSLSEMTFGRDHPETAHPLIALGEWYVAQGERKTAVALYQRAHSILENKVEQTHVSWQRLQTSLAALSTPFSTANKPFQTQPN